MAKTFKKTSQALAVYARSIIKELNKNLDESNIHASGELSESIDFNLFSTPTKIGYDIVMADYWGAVDEGRKPGKAPPPNALKEWLSYGNVQDKIGYKEGSRKSVGIRVTKGKDGKSKVVSELDTLAYLIGQKIAKKGTEGSDFFTDVVNGPLIDRFNNQIIEAIGFDVDALIEDVVGKFTEA